MTDDQIHILQIMTESSAHPRDATWEREAIAAALAEIGRLEAERDALLAMGWAQHEAIVMALPYVTAGEPVPQVVREVLRDALLVWSRGWKQFDACTRTTLAILDQAQRDTAAVAERERAGEAIDQDTMDFRVKGDRPCS